MKSLKNKYYLILLLFVSVISCTDNFDDYNQMNPGLVTEEMKEIDNNKLKVYFPQMLLEYRSPTYWIWQIEENLSSDIFSGYLAPNTDYGGNNNTTAKVNDNWNNYKWNRPYQTCMKNWLEIKNKYDESTKHIYGVALIWKVLSMMRVVDSFGPIIYSEYGSGKLSVSYDSEQDVYDRFFNELDSAVTNISTFATDYPGSKPLASVDLVFGGDYNKWMKLANSLKLRLAIRIAKVDPAKAKTKGEEVLASSHGFLEEDARYNNPLRDNSLIGVAYSYNNSFLNANFESHLNGYNDPRLEIMFSKTTVSQTAHAGDTTKKIRPPISDWMDKYVGVRIGIDSKGNASATRQLISCLGPKYELVNVKSTPVEIFNYAETYFLKAEAGLRGWNGAGDIKKNYEDGIEASFNAYGIKSKASAYINDETSKPAAHKDIVNAAYDIAPMSEVTIKWNDALTNEQKLEKIITQKWIANYPLGTEGWADYRRTGYPKLFPLVVNHSGGEVDSNLGVRRLQYTNSERNNNTKEYEKAVQLLSGKKDQAGVRIWWDVDAPNF
jgi:hypothetical protein